MAEESVNQAALDRFTSAHAGVGVTMAVLGVPWWAATLITVGWELVENVLKDAKPHFFPYSSHDSADNSVADSIAVILGFLTARHMMRRGLTDAGKAALGATVGSTVGCFFGSGVLGVTGRLGYGEREDAARGQSPVVAWARSGYMIGGGIGGAIAAARQVPSHLQESAGFGALVGGTAFGPLGAALGSYLAVGVAEEHAA